MHEEIWGGGDNLECKTASLINERLFDYSGTGEGKGCTELRGRGGRTCAEPFRTPFMKWTSCSMVPTASLGRKYCSLDVLRMMTEGTGTSLRGGGEERNTGLCENFGWISLHRHTIVVLCVQVRLGPPLPSEPRRFHLLCKRC